MKFGTRLGGMVLAAAAAWWAPAARGEFFFWLDGRGSTSAPGVTGSIFLTNDNVAQVDAFLAKQGAGTKAVKVEAVLTQATVDAIFNKYKVDYTFLDYEGANATANATATVARIKASTMTGPAVAANRAYVSNFAYSPAYGDPSAPNNGAAQALSATYASVGLNMVSNDLYPGLGSFRGPASGNSAAPNVRSALFAAPVVRLSSASAALPSGHANVPYVNRFNNWMNTALDTDGDPSNGYKFVTSNQLPSREDFKAQVLHYRLRGATGVHGLDGGVAGYTMDQFQADIVGGWTGQAKVNDLMGRADARLATLDTVATVDGVKRPLDETGVVFSGVYSLVASRMVMLMSNLDERAHTLTLPMKVGGKSLAGQFLLEAGSHEMVEFGISGGNWNVLGTTPVFESTDADRAGTGVPEPGAIGAIAVAAAMGLMRRRRAA
ncbi:MAG: PEP-CTERM sorting domain-containing protein [Phycisphaerae bacterium]|nr:PEP-CTERM sorting domain-containing protein [Tepidisphaeraceae bacterium]